MRLSSFALVGGMIAAPTMAATVSITIPRPQLAEYKKPYVAVYLEKPGAPAKTVAIWYGLNNRDGEYGQKWLTEVRSWWRKGGRSLHLPADGISGATRSPGTYTIALPADALAAGTTLTVEAAREHGGREFLTVPVKAGATASGKTELGVIAIR